MNIETTGEHFYNGANPSTQTHGVSPLQNQNDEFLTGWTTEKNKHDRGFTPDSSHMGIFKPENGQSTPTKPNNKVPLPTKVYHHNIPQIRKIERPEPAPKNSTRLSRTDHTNKASDRAHKSAVLTSMKSEPVIPTKTTTRKNSTLSKPAVAPLTKTSFNRNVSKQNIISPKASTKTANLLDFHPKLKPKHNRSLAELQLRKTFYIKKDPFSIYNTTDDSYVQNKKNKSQSHRPDGDVGIFYDEIDFEEKLQSSNNQRHTSHNAKRYYQATSTGSQYSRKTYFGISMIKEEPGNVLQKVQGGLDNKLIKSTTLRLDPLEMNERARIVKEYLQRISQKKIENTVATYGTKYVMAQAYDKMHSPRFNQTQQHYFNPRNLAGIETFDQNTTADIPSYYNATFNNQIQQSQTLKQFQPNKTTLAMIASPMPKSPTLEAWEEPASIRK